MPTLSALDRVLTQIATKKRETFILYDKTAVADDTGLTISRTDPFFISVILSGFTTGSGTVTVHGTDENDATTSKVTTFTGNERRLDTDQKFKTITRVETSGLTDEATVGKVKIEASSRLGEPDERLTALGTLECKLARTRLGEVIEVAGVQPLNSAIAIVRPKTEMLRNDRLIVDGESWEIHAVKKIYDFWGERSYDQLILVAEDAT